MVLSEVSTQWLEFDAQFCPGALLPHTELRGVGIVSAVEHVSVMAGGRFDEDQLFVFPVDGDGRIDVDEAQGLIDRIFNEIQDPSDIENRGEDPLFVASVMLEVNITCSGSAPASSATCARACSIIRRAARPSVCTLDALPLRSSAPSIASRASGRSGELALWSR